MLDEIKKNYFSLQILIILLILAVCIYIFQFAWQLLLSFSDIIVILICAWLLSFILSPFVNALVSSFKLSKIIAAFIVYTLFFALIAVAIQSFIPIVYTQMQQLVIILPKYIDSSPPFMHRWIGIAMSYLDNALPIISSLATFLFDALLVLIISFYFVIDGGKMNKEIRQMSPKKWRNHIEFTQLLVDTTFGSFIRVQLVFGVLSGVGTWIVLRLFNVDFAASTALLSGILTIIPVIGPFLAIIPPLLLPLLTNPTQAFLIFLVLLAMQQIIFNIIGPKLMSKAFKLHPIVILLSFIVGYRIAGGVGAIFAIPILGILMVLFHQLSHHFVEQYSK